MKGVIINFRSSRHRQKHNHMVIEVEGVDSKEKAAELVDKKVIWKSPANKELVGKVSGAHGNKGAVRAIFETGMPGQSVGQVVEIQ